MSPRVYTRKFDWDEARRRVANGETRTALAQEYGVSKMAVSLAVDDEARARSQARVNVWIRQAQCPDCGAQVTRLRKTDVRRCVACFAKAQASTVRDGELQCTTCKEWKPDVDFPNNASLARSLRRGRHRQCRVCQTEQKRAYRLRNPTYERDYARRRRHA